ncbi:gamma carbonic anhydrase family protein [bacterium]|nr:gamma carbonic anhydrase family protein [bacterium]
MIIKYKDFLPTIDESAFIDDSAKVIGDVVIGKESSVWFNAVIRGDVNSIKIGSFTNIQDNSVLHVTRKKEGIDPEKGMLVIGDYVTIGHNVVLHACTINSYALIGMGAVVLDRVEVGSYSVVAAGSVVKEGFKIPPYTLVAGNPAVIKKNFENREEIEKYLYEAAEAYFSLIKDYK